MLFLISLSIFRSFPDYTSGWNPWDYYTDGKLQGEGDLKRTFDGDVAAIVAKVLSIEKHNRGLFAGQAHVSLSPFLPREETGVSYVRPRSRILARKGGRGETRTGS